MKNKETLKRMWEMFVKNGHLDPGLSPVIKKSWLRSRSFSVNPYQKQGPPIGSAQQAKWADIIKAKQELIDVSLPLMESLYQLVKGSGFLVMLCDPNGLIVTYSHHLR